MSTARWLIGDVFERMAEIPDDSVDCIVTSPPFWALRSYLPADHEHKHLELGSEASPAEYLSNLLALTREFRRVLTPHGSICVELGDSYSGSGGAGGDYGVGGLREGQSKFDGSNSRRGKVVDHDSGRRNPGPDHPLAKSLCLIPSLYAGSLAYGHNLLDPDDRLEPWRIRNLIAWVRPNPPVGALSDKVRPATSYITVACTSAKRWFDLDAERGDYKPRGGPALMEHSERDRQGRGRKEPIFYEPTGAGAPLLDWWNIPPGGYSGAHYAVYPPELPRRLINLMCPRQVCVTCGEPRRRIVDSHNVFAATGQPTPGGGRGVDGVAGLSNVGHDNATQRIATTLGWSDCGHNTWRNGIVLDPFGGSGTTAMVASGLGRDSISIDLDPRNADLAYERVGMFLEVTP